MASGRLPPNPGYKPAGSTPTEVRDARHGRLETGGPRPSPTANGMGSREPHGRLKP